MIKQLVRAVFGTQYDREMKKIRPLVEAIKQEEARLAGLPNEAIQGADGPVPRPAGGAPRAGAGGTRRRCGRPSTSARTRTSATASRPASTSWRPTTRRRWRASSTSCCPRPSPRSARRRRRLVGTTVMVTGRELRWDMVPYDVQLIGGIVLHQGTIAEMATGEGKTLVATLPLYLNALAGPRRAPRHGQQLPGPPRLAVDGPPLPLARPHRGLPRRHRARRRPSGAPRTLADITYGTNNEFGFDYLRDNMVFALEQRVQRAHVYAIVDEVDSILIDEARTPLIISGPGRQRRATTPYAEHNRPVARAGAPADRRWSTQLLAEAREAARGREGDRRTAAHRALPGAAGHARRTSGC